MITISTERLLRLWTELEDALRGENSYGGDTAEIYVYTLADQNPSVHAYLQSSTPADGILRDAFEEWHANVKMNLFMVCCLFRDMRDCRITIEGMSLDEFRNSDRVFTHRVNVRVA